LIDQKPPSVTKEVFYFSCNFYLQIVRELWYNARVGCLQIHSGNKLLAGVSGEMFLLENAANDQEKVTGCYDLFIFSKSASLQPTLRLFT
jgi:hypothetical protein